MKSSNPKLSVIIISYNASFYLKKCLDSVYKSREIISFEVIVVDNKSSENNLEIIKSHPKTRLITNKDNKFFARANNQALSIARGDYILFLNPDTEITSGSLSRMVEYLEREKQVGVVGCKLLNSDGSLQSSIGNFPTVKNLINEYTFIFIFTKIFRKNDFQTKHAYAHPVESLLGACLLTRNKVITEAGPFDEYFNLYLEEVDWLYRVRNCGWLVIYWPEISIYHHSGKSANQSEIRRIKSLEENLKSQYRYFIKHHGRYQRLMAKSVLTFSLLFRLFLRSLTLIPNKTDRREIAKEKIKSYERCLFWIYFKAMQEKPSTYEWYKPDPNFKINS